MPRLSLVLLLGLAACSLSQASPVAGPGDAGDWHFASGALPTRAEYAAFVAACRDGAVRRMHGRPLAACLADLGLRHAD